MIKEIFIGNTHSFSSSSSLLLNELKTTPLYFFDFDKSHVIMVSIK